MAGHACCLRDTRIYSIMILLMIVRGYHIPHKSYYVLLVIGESHNINCHGCSESPIANVTFMCTDYSIEEDWSFGERRFIYTFNETSNITIAFTGNAKSDSD